MILYRFKKLSMFSRYRRRHTLRRAERIERERVELGAATPIPFLPAEQLPNPSLLAAAPGLHDVSVMSMTRAIDAEAIWQVA